MMTQQLISALDDCLRRMENSESIETCLRYYPELADELRPLLRAAQAAQALGAQIDVPEKSRRKSRAGFLQRVVYAQAAAGHVRRGLRRWSAPHWRLAFSLVIIGFMVFLGLSSAMVVSAQDSLPGEPLYSVKILSENLRLWLASPAEKPVLQEEFAIRRQTERILLTQTAQPKVQSTPTPEITALPGAGQPTLPPTQTDVDTPMPETPTSPAEETDSAQEQQEDDQQKETQEAQSDDTQTEDEDSQSEDAAQKEEKHLTESPTPGQEGGKEKDKSSDNEEEGDQDQTTPVPTDTDNEHDPVVTPTEAPEDNEGD